MPLPAIPADRLFIVTDKGKVIVARDRPVIEGDAESINMGSIVELELVPHAVTVSRDPDVREQRESTVEDKAPGMSGAIATTAIAGLAAVFVAILIGIWLTPWVSVPVAAFIAIYAFSRYLRRETMLEEAWRNNHRILSHYEDKQTFDEAKSAVKQIMDAWPRVGALVGVSDPSPALARSLWDLTEVLLSRARTRDNQQELLQAQVGLPADVRVKQEVADRLAQIEALLSQINADVERRTKSIKAIAEECRRFIREQQAIAQAREAVRGADQVLGSIVPSNATSPDTSEELSSRTYSILAAYRDLTKHLSAEEIRDGSDE